jgi:hypothetical protein
VSKRKDLTPDAKLFVSRVERMLAKGGTDGGLERQACRFITGEDEKTAFGVWRELMHYKFGMPTQQLEMNTTVNYHEVLTKMRERHKTANLASPANSKEHGELPVN